MLPESFHIGEPRARSVTALQQLYTVIMGLALTAGVKRLMDPVLAQPLASWLSDQSRFAAYLFLALLTTMLPFYHGAVRHLDDNYVFRDASRSPAEHTIYIEFILLFVEGVVFTAMGESIRNAPLFYVSMMALFAIDMFWAIVVIAATRAGGAPLRWLITNCVALLLLLAIVRTPLFTDGDRPILTMVVAILRSIVDYMLNWQFYAAKSPPQPSASSPA